MKVSIKDVGAHNRSGSCNDSDPQDVISVFLKGKFVEKCKIVKEKDLLMITGAQLERSSREGHQFNIMADESNDALKIWITQDPENKNKAIGNIHDEAVQKPLPAETTGNLIIYCYFFLYTGSPLITVLRLKVLPCLNCDYYCYAGDEPPSKRSRLVLQPKPALYTKLADLKVNTVVNVFGVVKFFKSPFKTRGSDFVCTLSLVDPSLDSLEESFKLVLFSKSKERLPSVRSMGDIVCFHHIAVGEYQGGLQGKFLPESSW